jgi:lysophospholipase L1-like esterase
MQAMNGSGGLSVRRLCRLLGCVAALAALSAMTMPSIADAKTPKIKKTYVALGDSLAFGYSQQLFNENEKTFENPAGFEHGYASDYYNEYVNVSGKYGYVNYACPGETTGSLIGNGPLLAKIQAAVPGVTGEAACAYHFADHLPMHNEYSGSQLESAIATINADKAAGKPVKVITLDIGANDQLHDVARIEKEVKEKITKRVTALAEAQATGEIAGKVKAAGEKEVQEYVIEQVIPQAYVESGGGIPPAFEEDIAKDAAAYAASHVAEDTSRLFADEAAYEGAHGAELEAEGLKLGEEDAAKYVAEHGAELQAEGNRIADELIAAGAPELDKEIITNVSGIIAALTNPAIDGSELKSAKIIFEGTYNAYGDDYGTGEVLPGSNRLVAALAGAERGAFARRPLKACFVDPQTLFNPASTVSSEPKTPEEKAELAKLQGEEVLHMSGAGHLENSWTNMGNFTKYEGKSDGPDIHATETGYKVMAKQISETCAF